MAAQPIHLLTTDGFRLEAQACDPSSGEAAPDGARAAVVMAHPHPQFGGSMHVPVLEELMRRLPSAGFGALRWNFRGVGASEGSHGRGIAETADVEAAIDAASARWPGSPIVALGYSFGAGVTLRCDDRRLSAWVAVAPQLDQAMVAGLDPRPKLLLVPSHDQFCNPETAREAIAGWTEATLVPLPSTDHFLAGSLQRIADLVLDFLSDRIVRP